MKNFLLVFILFAISCTSFQNRGPASNGVNFTPGLIPLEYGSRPATDLVHNGETLIPDDAHAMVLESDMKFDLSRLNPDETSILWKNKPVEPLDKSFDEISLNLDEKIKYLNVVPSRSGRFRFTIRGKDKDGGERTYIIMLSKQVHNLLLRKNLLRKLGYNIPAIKYFSKLKLDFGDPFSKEAFFTQLSESTLGDPNRWISDYIKHQREDEHRPGGDLNILKKTETDEKFYEKEKVSIVNTRSNKCLGRDIVNDSNKLYQTECKNTDFYGLNWVLEEKEEGYFNIKSAETGKCLDIRGEIKVKGADALEFPCNGQDNQLFKILKQNNGTSYIVSKHSNYCLDVQKRSKDDHAQIHQWKCHYKDSQTWKIQSPVSGDGARALDEIIEMEDVVIMEAQSHFYNLALGFLPPEIIRGRRILNSLLVPYSIVETPESINLMHWHAGRVVNKQVKLPMESADNFSTTNNDAKWITRRVLKLERKDWEEIVTEAFFPKEVGMLLTEKLISRRNHLIKLFNMDSDLQNLESDSEKITFINKNSKKCLGKKKVTKGTRVYQYDCNSFAANNLEFKLEEKEDGYFAIKSSKTGKCLDIYGNSRINGGDLSEYKCHYKDNQLFKLNRKEDGTTFITVKSSNKCLDVTSRSTESGKKVHQWSCHHKESQGWFIVPSINKNTDKSYFDIAIKTNLSHGKWLKKGKLLKENWEGYASRFSFGDPENPLSGSEVGNFIASKITSGVMAGLMDQLNQRLNNQTLIEGWQNIRNAALKKEQIINSIKQGSLAKIPFGIFAYPTFGGNIILNRDIVIGAYLGTENKVQMADTIGFSVNAGMAAHMEGLAGILPPPMSLGISGTAKVSYSRTYSHLKPIKSFKAGNKYNFKNLLVPLLKRKQGKLFDGILDGKLEGLDEEARQNKISEVMNIFKKEMDVGESLIISDNIVFGANINAGLSFVPKLVSITAGAAGTNLTVNRLHIHRKDEDTIHIYKDLGNITSLLLHSNFKALVPVLGLSIKFSAGKARVKFWDLNLESDEKKNPDIVKNAGALRQVLMRSKTKSLEKVKKPFKIYNTFKESLSKAYFTMLNAAKLRAKTSIELIHPKGHKKDYFQSAQALRLGYNAEKYAIDAVNSIFGSFTEYNIHLSSISKGAPGDSLGGGQKLFKVTYQGEVTEKRKDKWRDHGKIEKPFVQINESYRGFTISKDGAAKLLKKLNEKYSLNFFPENVLQQTKRIFLYNIGVDIHIYDGGLNHLAGLSQNEVKAIVKQHAIGAAKWGKRQSMKHSFKWFKYWHKKDRYMKQAHQMRHFLSKAARWLSIDGLKKLLGGDDNFFVISRVSGFRIDDEDGDQQILSNSLGQIGAESVFGPIKDITSKIGISESEFFAYWIRGNIN